MRVSGKETIKNILGQIPFTAELYWLVRQRGGPLQSRFSLRGLQAELPGILADVNAIKPAVMGKKKIFLFASLHYWIEHTALVGLSLAAQGYQVTLGYLPYSEWNKPINRFDLRRQNSYAYKVLKQAEPFINVVPFLNLKAPYSRLNDDVMEAVKLVSTFDTQYTLQVEETDENSDIYRMRYDRNLDAGRAALWYFQNNRPDVVIIPNGTIQETGVVYRIARHLRIPTVTYEFGDQRQRIWLAQNAEVMRQDTEGMWKARQARSLSETQMERLQNLFQARQRAALWENFARLWQGVPAQGGEQARKALGLDSRPVVLLATNVLGDSLTLGRQVFSKSMEEWISRTVQYFAGRPDVQLVIRVHPGEVLVHGTSMMDVVHQVLHRLPEHIRLIGPKDKVNTYDLMEVADLGLVYTTTVGMEMAMMGVPVIVSGQTHYRGHGFTHDPDSWVTYFKQLGQILDNPKSFQLSHAQVERAIQYVYGFFFDFPRPFPWHLVRMWEDYKTRPLSAVLNPEGKEHWEATFRYLTGEPVDWQKIIESNGLQENGVAHPAAETSLARPGSAGGRPLADPGLMRSMSSDKS